MNKNDLEVLFKHSNVIKIQKKKKNNLPFLYEAVTSASTKSVGGVHTCAAIVCNYEV